ncbi:MAG: hypothetical protein PHD20_06485 [Clostridia bacterium]|nr:hypothetical protein [Clostridia bacterium]MDD4781075.1 hypothetical protein [Tissierellia bacterium]
MNRFRMFMMGRYGTDQLSMALLILGMTLSFVAETFSSSIITLLSYIVFFICIYRIMSRDIALRSQENYKFLRIWSPINKTLQSKVNMLKGRKYYKYFKCPSCKQMIRAPKGKGKIAVTCPKCKNKFIKQT